MATLLLASDAPQLPPATTTNTVPGTVKPESKVADSGVKITGTREYTVPPGESVTTTTTTTGGFPDLIPTLIPALQSSSYVLVILTAFVAWSSRKLVTDFLDRHLELMSTVKESLESEKNNNEKHLAVLQQLTKNNETLANTVDKLSSK